MAGLWSKRFNYKDGEDRVCKGCGDTFHTLKPLYTCRKCTNAKQKIKEEAKRKLYEKKDNYPYYFEASKGWHGSAKQHFSNIRVRNNKAWKEGREGLTRFYSEIFEEIEKNGIMKWIMDRRDRESLDKDRKKRDTKIISDFPDTRSMPE